MDTMVAPDKSTQMTDALRVLIMSTLRLTPPGVVMEGWCTPERGVELAQLILDQKPHVVVEIGVFGGRSLVAQAMAIRENGFGHIYGIDPWKLEPVMEGETDPEDKKWWAAVDLHDIHSKAMQAIWSLGLDEWVTVIRDCSQRVAHLFAGGIDVLLIDGNHSEIASCRDVMLFLPSVRPSGFVIMDDCDWVETRLAQDLLEASCDIERSDGHMKFYRKRSQPYETVTCT